VVTGTKIATEDNWWANDGIQQVSISETWEASGVGVTSGEAYEATYRRRTKGVGWNVATTDIWHTQAPLKLK
jgi:hypothetical protein